MAVDPGDAAQNHRGRPDDDQQIRDPGRPWDDGGYALVLQEGRLQSLTRTPGDQDHDPGRQAVAEPEQEMPQAEWNQPLENVHRDVTVVGERVRQRQKKTATMR